jgi:hypothetical protein
MKYIVKPKLKSSVVIREVYLHIPTGKVGGVETTYRYESYIVDLPLNVKIEDIENLSELDLTDGDIVDSYETYEEAEDVTSVEGDISDLSDELQDEIQEYIEEEDLSWDEFFDGNEDWEDTDYSHKIECEFSIELKTDN